MACSICYSETLKSPRKLKCGHSFCSECIATWLDVSKGNDCPECRTVVEIPFKPSCPSWTLRVPMPTVRIRPVDLSLPNYSIPDARTLYENALLYSIVAVMRTIGLAVIVGVFYLVGWYIHSSIYGDCSWCVQDDGSVLTHVALSIGYIIIGMASSLVACCFFAGLCGGNYRTDRWE